MSAKLKKKGVLEHSVCEVKKIGYFFQNPQRFPPLKIQYFLADFSRFVDVSLHFTSKVSKLQSLFLHPWHGIEICTQLENNFSSIHDFSSPLSAVLKLY